MSDESSQSRKPRTNGASSEHSSPSFGDTIRSWLKALSGSNDADLKASLEEVLDEHGEGPTALDLGQREMLRNILSVGELQVDDVMVPRADIDAVSIDTSLEELVLALRTARHSRLPVYRDNLDDIVGFIHIKDVIDYWSSGAGFAVKKILREPLVVPPSMLLLELLSRMRTTRIHMAIVVDEYGGVDGLVTIEDVVEEIVGDIADEHDLEAEVPAMVENEDGSIEADGRVTVEDFEARFRVDLLPDKSDEDIDTLGGFVVALLGHLPRRGELLSHPSGFEFEVMEADPRRIKRLLIRRALSEPAPAAD